MVQCAVQISFKRFFSHKTVQNISNLKSKYDVVVIGGGHNGLVSAGYLSREGLQVCVLERRPVVGGAAVTEEIVPGFKFSRASYVLSLLRPQIIDDLELKKYGLKVYRREPSSYTPLITASRSDGGPRSLTLGSNRAFNQQQIAQFSQKDAKVYNEYEASLGRLAKALDAVIDLAPADVMALAEEPTYWAKIRKTLASSSIRSAVGAFLGLGSNISSLYEFLTSPSINILRRWFESEPLIATLATDSVIGSMASPDTPGTAYCLLHHVMGEVDGVRGAWGYPEGGMGAVTGALAAAAAAKGAHIFTNSHVSKIKTNSEGHAVGVVLQSGQEVKAKVVLSNATAKVTFLDLTPPEVLPENFRQDVKNIDYTSPVTKINDIGNHNLPLREPLLVVAVSRLPDFIADRCTRSNVAEPHHQCTIHLNCESSDILQRAYMQGCQGHLCDRPLIEMVIPSSVDPSLAPPDAHVCLLFTQYTPYLLAGGKKWDEAVKEEYCARVFKNIEEYAPGFTESVVGKEVLSPPDLEDIFGLTGGNIFHGAISPHQLFLSRPTPARSGSADCVPGSPLTPVPRLLLCGSGAHPGGGVMGAPGRIAALTAFNLICCKKFTH